MSNHSTEFQRALPRAFRLWLIVGLVLLQLVTVGVILLSSHYRSEGVLLTHMRGILGGAADQSVTHTQGFLDPAVRVANLTSGLLEDGELDIDDPVELEQYFLELMDANPEFDGVYHGGADGSFVFVSRDGGQPGSVFRTKVVPPLVDGGETTLRWADAQHRVVMVSSGEDDRYDPRVRPWYRSAETADAAIWTDPYIFFSSQQPGVTVARAVRSSGKMVGAVGVDINVSALSGFLDSLDVGVSGSAFIIDESGRLVAFPDLGEIPDPELAREVIDLDKITDPAARAAYGAFLEGGGAEVSGTRWEQGFELGGERYQATFVPFSIDEANTWIIGVYAPEDDFLGDLRSNERMNNTLAIMIALVLALAGLWIARRVSAPVMELQGKADTDQLTGLANRRHLLDTAAQMATQAAIQDRPIAVAMVDVDNFKVINDTHGHAIGDEVLVALAGRIRQALRQDDFLARYGGEEFTVVMPDTDLRGAFSIVDRLRTAVGGEPVRTSGGTIEITLSAGVAELSAEVPDFDSVLHEADLALYRAKELGRNCVIAAGV